MNWGNLMTVEVRKPFRSHRFELKEVVIIWLILDKSSMQFFDFRIEELGPVYARFLKLVCLLEGIKLQCWCTLSSISNCSYHLS